MLITKEAEKQQKRAQILDAARALFTEFGYRSVSVAEIAQRAQVAKGTVYLYFRDKEEMFLTLVREFETEMKQFVGEVEARNLTLTDELHTVIYNLLKYRRDQKFLYRVMREALEMRTPLALRVTDILDGEISGYIEQKLRDAVAQGQIRPCNPQVFSFLILRIYSALAFEWEENHPPLDERQVAETVSRIIKDGLLLRAQ